MELDQSVHSLRWDINGDAICDLFWESGSLSEDVNERPDVAFKLSKFILCYSGHVRLSALMIMLTLKTALPGGKISMLFFSRILNIAHTIILHVIATMGKGYLPVL